MMKNNKLGSLFWILLVVCILNIVGHLAVYPALPGLNVVSLLRVKISNFAFHSTMRNSAKN